ncbi:ATP-binding protein [Marinilabilia salmonicolor]|uniref:ATP-binding protein n=1 Tax=Marinilabilia salmonicolor TaxID=989 RepID=UPI00029A411E|nr:ATP-binding protein [Marinilabilia salmonicolor]
MKLQTNYPLLGYLEEINDKVRKSRLKDPTFSDYGEEMGVLCDYFKVNRFQAAFLAVLFDKGHDGEKVGFDDIVRHLDCSALRLLKFQDEIAELVDRNFIGQKKSSDGFRRKRKVPVYRLNNDLLEAVLKNRPMPELLKETYEDILDVLGGIADLEQEDDLEEMDLLLATRDIVADNLDFPLLKHIQDLKLPLDEQYILLTLFWSAITGEGSRNLNRLVQDVHGNSSENIKCRRDFVSGKNKLVKMELVKTSDAEFFDDAEIMLASKGRNLLKEHGVKIMGGGKRSDVLRTKDIIFRELFFEEETNRQLSLLEQSLQEEQLKEIRTRLKQRGLAEGIATLFYGVPGTGKTEMAKQLARATGRDIMKVEISKTKSMWYGESEKIIKRVFADYADFTEDCEQLPILLFNEADAVFSKRQSISQSNVVKTENAIQNIILEELENFKGILIATTNLQDNLDGAFERRFLFKVQFRKPGLINRARIWESKLNSLSKEEARMLASKYDFSGGEIDNIVRKWEIHSLINGEADVFSSIEGFCNDERLGEKTRSIGFGR